MSETTVRFPKSPVPPRPIRWQSLTLAMAGFCVGMVAHHMARPGLALIATCGSVVLLASVALMAWIAHRRREQACRAAIERATLRLQTRLERHCRVPRPHVRRRFGTTRADRQYLTVVRGPGRS